VRLQWLPAAEAGFDVVPVADVFFSEKKAQEDFSAVSDVRKIDQTAGGILNLDAALLNCLDDAANRSPGLKIAADGSAPSVAVGMLPRGGRSFVLVLKAGELPLETEEIFAQARELRPSFIESKVPIEHVVNLPHEGTMGPMAKNLSSLNHLQFTPMMRGLLNAREK